eukprot:423883_1
MYSFLLLLSLSIITWLSASAPLNSCTKQNACLDWTITRKSATSVCEYEICAVYNPKKATCTKNQAGDEGPSHVCYDLVSEDVDTGAKDFCKACDSELDSDGLCGGQEPEETFCCGKCKGERTASTDPEDPDYWCKELDDPSYDSSVLGVCGGTINCWTVQASSSMAISRTLFGFKDGNACEADFDDSDVANDATRTIQITNAAIPGAATATVGCKGQGSADRFCQGGNKMECGFGITIPVDPSCGVVTPTPECASDSDRLEQISTPLTPTNVITIPLAVYWLLVVQSVCWVLFVFIKYVLSVPKSGRADFMNVKHLDDEEMNGLNA